MLVSHQRCSACAGSVRYGMCARIPGEGMLPRAEIGNRNSIIANLVSRTVHGGAHVRGPMNAPGCYPTLSKIDTFKHSVTAVGYRDGTKAREAAAEAANISAA